MFRFQRITADMTQEQASQQYETYRKLSLNEDGTFYEDGALDQMRVDHALNHGRVPTRGEMRAQLRREEAERAKLPPMSDAECAELYAATLRRKH